MHEITLPAWVSDQPPNAVHDFGALEGERTALLVVDLQKGFVEPGYALEIAPARSIVPTVNRLIGAVRPAGVTVVFLRHTVSDDPGLRTPAWQLGGAEGRARRRAELGPDAEGNTLCDELDVRPEDLVVRKYRPSAFVPGTSNLPQLLGEREIDTLIVVGIATNVCCESTVRDANMLDYKVYVVADATATYNDELHNASLLSMSSFFARIVYADDIVAMVAGATTPSSTTFAATPSEQTLETTTWP